MNPLGLVLIWLGVLGFIGMVGYASMGGAAWIFAAVVLAGIALVIRWK